MTNKKKYKKGDKIVNGWTENWGSKKAIIDSDDIEVRPDFEVVEEKKIVSKDSLNKIRATAAVFSGQSFPQQETEWEPQDDCVYPHGQGIYCKACEKNDPYLQIRQAGQLMIEKAIEKLKAQENADLARREIDKSANDYRLAKEEFNSLTNN